MNEGSMKKIFILFLFVFNVSFVFGQAQVTCPTCSGMGRIEKCKFCGGSGASMYYMGVKIPCVGCAGTGLTYVCISCKGSGKVSSNFIQSEAALKRGYTAFEQGNYNTAVTEFTEAIRLNPTNITYSSRGMTYQRRNNPGDIDLAINDYTQSLQIFSFGLIYYYRGQCYEAKNDNVRAIADYEAALRLHPNDQTLKDALARLGRTSPAQSNPTYVPPSSNPTYTPPGNTRTTVQCNNCGGTGKCTMCRGNYRQSCRDCDGSGRRMYGYGTNKKLDRCTTCNGMGYQLCIMYGKTCSSGNCVNCYGKGVLQY